MIRITKSSEPPKILKDNYQHWTKKLDDAVNTYGGYSKIPINTKEKLLKFYRSKDIQDALSKASYKKCAFCECIPSEGGNLEVEHFAPKSKYHTLAFDWDNLLPVCRKCNGAKSDHDTIKEPILNPGKEDTEKYLDFNFIDIIANPQTNNYHKADLTIKVCGLNDSRLLKARADIYVRLRDYEKSLLLCIESVEQANTDRTKKNKIMQLRDSIETIESLTDKSEKYSLFSKKFLEKSPAYLKAKTILNNYFNEIY